MLTVVSMGRPAAGRRTPAAVAMAGLIGREPLITFVTFGELTKWAKMRRWGGRPAPPIWRASPSRPGRTTCR